MPRVEFKLTMPNRGSWNGGWSGEGRRYVIYRTLSDADVRRLFEGDDTAHWHYSWGDGWGAGIHARVMPRGERKTKSDGFNGYDWMVTNIIRHGSPYEPKAAVVTEGSGDA